MSGAGGDLKKDFKRMIKHSKRMFKEFFIEKNHSRKCDSDDDYKYCNGPWNHGQRPGFGSRPPGYPPFSPFKNPITILFYPKIIVGCLIFITLICCGVGFYGLIIIILLMLLFIFI